MPIQEKTRARDTCWLPEEGQGHRAEKVHISVVGNGFRLDTIKKVAQTYLPRIFADVDIVDAEFANVIVGTFADLGRSERVGHQEGYRIFADGSQLIIAGDTEFGVLYGFYEFLKKSQQGCPLLTMEAEDQPAMEVRMINHWDNLDGSVERGYAGKSLFFDNNAWAASDEEIVQYAEMLSSIGINALTINNVNVHAKETELITEKWLPQLAKVANLFDAYHITLFLSANFASPMTLGHLQTADPLDKRVVHWWKTQVEEIYKYIPTFGGFVIKADSEHRPGPFTYGRTHAQGANMLADALKPYGGVVFWRCFVYDCLQDWRDRSTDRAKAAYEHFAPLDGTFADNVILQIKNGPMDFQVREPVSPLFGALTQTNYVMELQITQEYTGQQIDVCYLPMQWQEIWSFDTHANGEGTKIADLLSSRQQDGKGKGVTAVSNIGNNQNWTGHPFAQANLYGYGQLAWNPEQCPRKIAEEWAKRTYAHLSAEVRQTICSILKRSWSVYEAYTAPLGVGWMVNTGHHYGPNVNGYEYSPWGTYHFSDRSGLGVDRTKTGSNYISQYKQPVAELYGNVATCPDELLLFFHHVPYTHMLKSGKTVIQHIYDAHFEGVEEVEAFLEAWEGQKEAMPDSLYMHVKERFEAQLANAREWRDQVNTYYYRMSGINDERGRTIYK
ncbi:alpha-glucuronidase [Bacillus sp. FSL K6-6483]|uniref:Alpha-glucuronidase n=1 Tax=Shouchella clausii (strain KSM-K16) TaxID=66692 RepID=Q5WKL0_SHOC1|nr:MULTISPECIES: alpha-glucuronidase [Shouchella]MCM3379565.1 alpha-glucuronidase [Shouchella rhizosphaerae]BAD63095.1 alpha-glucuronidase [Shouchella clausii KSM-K16]